MRPQCIPHLVWVKSDQSSKSDCGAEWTDLTYWAAPDGAIWKFRKSGFYCKHDFRHDCDRTE